MEWAKLRQNEKLSEDEAEESVFKDYPINPFEKDYQKIVSSAVFRRLQDKTQVFPLDRNDFIRTRLTHSIEVSTIARQLGIMICNTKKEQQEDIRAGITEEAKQDIPSILLCAGLLHDLGNPPFGHFGETIIGEWFQKNLDSDTLLYKGKHLREVLGSGSQMVMDLEHFEGNAQALRILLKAQHGAEINLSQSVISTLVKYPVSSLDANKKDHDIKKHKLGYYYAEQKGFYKLSELVGTGDGTGQISRHPLAYLLEAADDISYATADLEDAFKKRLFTLDEFINYFRSQYDPSKAVWTGIVGSPEYYSKELIEKLESLREEDSTKKMQDENRVFQEWMVYTRRWLMYVVSYRFSKSYSEIMEGTYQKDLFWGTNHGISIQILKDAMKKFVFNSPGILKLELSAQTILSFLLDRFVHAVLYYGCEDKKAGYEMSKGDKKYMDIFSKNYQADYEKTKTGDEPKDLYLRLLMVTDYISGMTDSYARTLYRQLSGIE